MSNFGELRITTCKNACIYHILYFMTLECLIRRFFSVKILCKKKQNKKPNKKTELSFPNDYSLYIPMDLYNFDTPNPWLPNPYSGEHDLKKQILNLPYLRILSRTNSILLGPENMHSFWIISTWKKVGSFILTHWIFFSPNDVLCQVWLKLAHVF